MADGAKLALEAADVDVWPEFLVFAGDEFATHRVRSFIVEAARRGVRVAETTERVLAQVSQRNNRRTLIGVYRQRLAPLDGFDSGTVIALEGIRDPGNLGTILRTADCAGAAGVVLIGESCDPFSGTAVRASMGSVFTMKVARASFDELLQLRAARDAVLVGASLKGAPLHDGRVPRAPVVLLMGNEQRGLPEWMERACDTLVRIPMCGRADSLNIAVATGVIVYYLWQRAGYGAPPHAGRPDADAPGSDRAWRARGVPRVRRQETRSSRAGPSALELDPSEERRGGRSTAGRAS